MKVLYSHHGMKGKNGWGRTFYMAQGLADLGHDVTLLTINPKCSFFKINTIIYQGVKIKVLPDFFPAKMKSSGFAIWSTLFGLIYSMFHKFEICIADCGHRFTSLPCKLNRFIYHSVYISEWWDFFGNPLCWRAAAPSDWMPQAASCGISRNATLVLTEV